MENFTAIYQSDSLVYISIVMVKTDEHSTHTISRGAYGHNLLLASTTVEWHLNFYLLLHNF